MSFLFGGRPQLSSSEKIAAAETEIEMVSDMFNRLTQSCAKKCIPPDYREGDLNKGESRKNAERSGWEAGHLWWHGLWHVRETPCRCARRL